MENAVTERTPLHLWIVGGLATLWNCMGPLDYTMTRLHNDGWLKASMPTVDPQSVYSYIDSFPIWASTGWALGVWLGLAGSILLLMRNRWAVPAFGISLIGAIVGLGYQFMNPPNWPGMGSGMSAIMPIVIIVVAIGLFLYARAMSNRGILR
jgi:hypothetical protein